MKYLKAMWIASAPGGNVSITGIEEFVDEMVSKPGGGRVHRKGSVGTVVPVTPMMDDGDDKQIHKRTSTRLFAGEFMVQDTPNNRQVLKDHVRLGFVQMDDYDLHYEMLEETPLEEEVTEQIIEENIITETDVSPKHSPAAVRARNQERDRILQEATVEANKENVAAAKALGVLTCIKMRREEIISGIIDKGVMNIEQLASTDMNILLSISYVGKKVAESIIEEAQKLSGGSKEE